MSGCSEVGRLFPTLSPATEKLLSPRVANLLLQCVYVYVRHVFYVVYVRHVFYDIELLQQQMLQCFQIPAAANTE